MLKNLFFIFFSLQNLMAQDQATPVQVEAIDPQIKNLEWNRYTSKNFTVLSIDNQKGKDLSETIDSLKSSVLTRWGFPDVKFTK
jgi:hypothetical protein